MSAESPLIRHLRHHLLARRRHRAVLMLVLAGLLACLPLAAALALAAAWLTGVSGPLLALLLMLVPALLLVDIDRLAQINATHGQAAGDRVLQVVAEQCHRPLRQHDLCGRHGGEEFALMLPGTGRDGALTVAERLRRTLPEQRIVLPDGAVVSARVSIGVAVLAPDCASLPQLLARADEALHRAKREGRDRVACAAPVPS
jgi:diguanylate cyclase (GGDEF)-like protein